MPIKYISNPGIAVLYLQYLIEFPNERLSRRALDDSIYSGEILMG